MNSAKYPLVSIVIPSYNSKDSILETLESVKNQIYQNWECIIVDDGSTDDTKNIVKNYIQEDSRFTFLERNRLPKGGSVCRNIGIENSKGEYLIFLDSDDLFIETTLSNRVQKIMETPDLQIAIFKMGAFFKKIGDSQEKLTVDSEENPLFRFLKHDIPWQITAPIWKLSFLKKIGGFNELYPRLQDPELHTRALLYPRCTYKKFEDTDCFYRLHDEVKRKQDDNFIDKVVTGFSLYMQDVSILLDNYPNGQFLKTKYLKKNLFIALRKYASRRSTNRIKACKQLISVAKKNHLISFSEKIVLNIVVFLYAMNVNKFTRVDKFIANTLLRSFKNK